MTALSGAGACGDIVELPPQPQLAPNAESTKDLGFRHPLLGVQLIDGKVPGVDIHVDPITGEGFAVGEVTTQLRDAAEETVSGIRRVQVLPIPPQPTELPSVLAATAEPKPVIRGELIEALAVTPQDEPIWVQIRVADDDKLEHLNQSLDRAIGLGQVQSKVDFDAVRKQILEARRQAKATMKAPLAAALHAMGVEFVERKFTNGIVANLLPSQINELAARADVHSISLPRNGADKSAYCPEIPSSWLGTSLDGVEVSHGTQLRQFMCDGHSGNGVYAGIIEDGVTKLNYGRFSDSGNAITRLLARRDCGVVYCDNASSGDETFHASKTTGLLLGDLRQGQDANVTSDIMRLTYSGYSPRLSAYAYAIGDWGWGSVNFETAVDEVLSETVSIDLVNISWGIGPEDTSLHDCYGDWDEDEAVNQLYESGTLAVVAAGNDGQKGCKVNVPGTALSALTIGSIGTALSGTNIVEDVIHGDISHFSSGGGQSGRTIVDIMGPGYRNNMMGSAGSYGVSASGTSFATPTVAAGLSNFIDFYESHYSSWIRSPGAMHSQMLLMGDTNGSTGHLTTRYDNDWGAGRFHARKFDSPGMDSPWQYGRYSVCVSNGTSVNFSLGTVPAAVDHLRVVAWWYDRRHDNSGTLDNIDLHVTTNNYVTIISNGINEEKERVDLDLSSAGNVPVTVSLVGTNVTADNEGCGTNSMRVYLGWYYEDTARDDADGPNATIQPD